MGFLSNLGSRFGHGGSKLPPGNSQWAQLANFFPDDGTGMKKDDRGQSVDVAGVLSALQGLSQPPPPQAPQPEWMPMPQPRFSAQLQNAPRYGQGQMMPTPAWMQPYMWGAR